MIHDRDAARAQEDVERSELQARNRVLQQTIQKVSSEMAGRDLN